MKIVGMFGADAAKERAEDFCEKLQKADPDSYYEVQETQGYPRFTEGPAGGVVISYYVVKIGNDELTPESTIRELLEKLSPSEQAIVIQLGGWKR